MSEKYKGYFFNVGNDTTWMITENISDALAAYYSFKSTGMKNVRIWDAVTNTTIKN